MVTALRTMLCKPHRYKVREVTKLIFYFYSYKRRKEKELDGGWVEGDRSGRVHLSIP